MPAQETPYRAYWWPFGLEAAGVFDGAVEGPVFPPIPRELTGDLAWLAGRPTPGEWSIGTEPVAELPALEAACARLGLTLPAVFTDFLRSPLLQSKIRSGAGSFVDVGEAPVRAPGAPGHLIRFLADQQGCAYWYLHVTAESHAVVLAEDLYDDPEDGGDADDDNDDGVDIELCGESFEAFLYRLWLENEIWFAAEEGDPMPDDAEEYIRRYRATADR